MRAHRSTTMAILMAMALLAGPASAQTAAPVGAQVYFIEPADGASVKSPVTVKFGLKGMGVAPALVEWPGTGHHHLLINRDASPGGSPIPNDPTAVHFGGGQTEAQIPLAPGTHTLLLQLGDYQHIPHDPPLVSPKITITVVP
jgi:hypothetical protein